MPAQNVVLPDKRIQTVKIGYLGAWYSNEYSIFRSLSIDVQAGVEPVLRGSSLSTTSANFWGTLSVTPRWYHRASQRRESGKILLRNNADFVGVELKYLSDFSASRSAIKIVPKWVFRRAIRRFTFELGLGYGVFLDNAGSVFLKLDLPSNLMVLLVGVGSF